jgi:hypothetical protein
MSIVPCKRALEGGKFGCAKTGCTECLETLYWTESGLPCGVQLIGGFGEEAKLLRLAAQLEKAQPWFGRKPQILS